MIRIELATTKDLHNLTDWQTNQFVWDNFYTTLGYLNWSVQDLIRTQSISSIGTELTQEEVWDVQAELNRVEIELADYPDECLIAIRNEPGLFQLSSIELDELEDYFSQPDDKFWQKKENLVK